MEAETGNAPRFLYACDSTVDMIIDELVTMNMIADVDRATRRRMLILGMVVIVDNDMEHPKIMLADEDFDPLLSIPIENRRIQ